MVLKTCQNIERPNAHFPILHRRISGREHHFCSRPPSGILPTATFIFAISSCVRALSCATFILSVDPPAQCSICKAYQGINATTYPILSASTEVVPFSLIYRVTALTLSIRINNQEICIFSVQQSVCNSNVGEHIKK